MKRSSGGWIAPRKCVFLGETTVCEVGPVGEVWSYLQFPNLLLLNGAGGKLNRWENRTQRTEKGSSVRFRSMINIGKTADVDEYKQKHRDGSRRRGRNREK